MNTLQNFDDLSKTNFLEYVQKMEKLDNLDSPPAKLEFEEEEIFSGLKPEQKQMPWKEMHYKRSLSAYIKAKYKKKVKITNKFAEIAYRDMYQERIKNNFSVNRYLRVFYHPDITKTDFEFIKSCKKEEVKYIIYSQAAILSGIAFGYFKTNLGNIIKKKISIGIGICLLPGISMLGITMMFPLIIDKKIARAGLLKKYELEY